MEAVRHPQPRLLATFPSLGDAERAARRVRLLVGDRRVDVGSQEDHVDALIASQRREMDELVIGGPVPMSGPQVRGALLWGFGGAVAGAIIGAIIGVLLRADGAPQWTIALGCALAGALAASTAMFVYGGGHDPNAEGVIRSNARDVVVSVTAEPSEIDVVQHALVEEGAIDIVRGDEQPARPAENIETPPETGPTIAQ